MPKDSSKKEARECAIAKIMNPATKSVEFEICVDRIEVTVGYYDGTTEEFRWYD